MERRTTIRTTIPPLQVHITRLSHGFHVISTRQSRGSHVKTLICKSCDIMHMKFISFSLLRTFRMLVKSMERKVFLLKCSKLYVYKKLFPDKHLPRFWNVLFSYIFCKFIQTLCTKYRRQVHLHN